MLKGAGMNMERFKRLYNLLKMEAEWSKRMGKGTA